MSRASVIAPRAYLWRRLHSIMGLMIVLFLIEHIITNSQAALLIGDNGIGFINAVNFIKNLPYLPVLEIVLIGTPIFVHAFLGVKYLMTGKMNSWPSSGNKPSLTRYSRNHAYSWQRITSWILMIGIILHVWYMRFYHYPTQVRIADKEFYVTRVTIDPGLESVAKRLGVTLYTAADIIDNVSAQPPAVIQELSAKSFNTQELMAVSPDFGTATLLIVRDAFKSPFKGLLYTLFVLAASFHAFNGLWTFCMTWGWVIKARSQATLVNLCTGIMVIIALLGLACIWGTYWVNLPR
jgi:succinate dehydrogenase / fumarate reductase, cytochrome b subunit